MAARGEHADVMKIQLTRLQRTIVRLGLSTGRQSRPGLVARSAAVYQLNARSRLICI